jgi:type II secretory pathway pseudopilin PulG
MNDQTNSSANLAPRRKGLAVASKVIGIISFITCSFFLVGAITGLVLGIVALVKAKKQPELYGGEKEARQGLTFSALSFLSLVVAVILLPNFLIRQDRAREMAAMREVQVINNAQLRYSFTKGHGKYTDLRTLGEEELIDPTLATGQKGGYIFTSNPVEGSDKPMYDTTARPGSTGMFGIGNRSFYSNETGIVYDADGGEPPKATPQDRVPKNGSPLF